ncbi:hypothetical protein CJF30_00005174 [Rutstroemia sp. NJR-2017a BBW]|nr:hypothetical protein CJF30_00005174 [Rutstroemia sp. NJR-2017a BBW]
MNVLNDGQLRRFAQSEYAAGMLYIITLAAAKLSIVLLLRNISPDVTHTRINTILGSLISSWCIGSVFALAFQCNLPRPWNSIDGVCHDRVS